MKLLHGAPPEFDAITKAFTRAAQVPARHALQLRVGIVHRGTLCAEGVLKSYRQVAHLSQHMHELGYAERLLGTCHEMHDCDVVFTHSEPQHDADPSFIRRPAVELWPLPG